MTWHGDRGRFIWPSPPEDKGPKILWTLWKISVNLVQHLYRHQISERLRFFKSIYMKLLLEIPILKRYIVASRKCATKLFANIHERIYQLLVTSWYDIWCTPWDVFWTSYVHSIYVLCPWGNSNLRKYGPNFFLLHFGMLQKCYEGF